MWLPLGQNEPFVELFLYFFWGNIISACHMNFPPPPCPDVFLPQDPFPGHGGHPQLHVPRRSQRQPGGPPNVPSCGGRAAHQGSLTGTGREAGNIDTRQEIQALG